MAGKEEKTQFQHINHALVPKTHPPMYLMHKFWARKPHNVVREYIEHYSNPNEIILDPFSGSGITSIEALKCGRSAISLDINPLSELIVETTIKDIDLDLYEETYRKITKDVRKKIEKLYEIECPSCSHKALLEYIVWSNVVKCPSCDKEIIMANAKRPKGKKQNIYKCPSCKEDFSYAGVEIIKEVPILAIIKCGSCGAHGDIENPKINLPKINLSSIWYPKIKFSYNTDKPFITKRRASTIEELFTPRNLYALALLNQSISKLEDPMKKVFQMVFSSTIPQASKMMIVTETQGPGWKMPEYLVWATHCEFDVWSRFANRFHTVKRGLENRIELMSPGKIVKDFHSLESGKGNIYIDTKNALDLSDVLPPNSIDYVFTDPPYGGSIQYFELDMIRMAWFYDEDYLKQWWDEEITINPRGQGKTFDYYHKMLSASFSQIYKVLKPNHYLTVTFHSTDIDVWNSIIVAIRIAGFELEKIIYQPPAKASARAKLQPYGSAIGDYYIRFKKPEHENDVTETQKDRGKYERVIIETTKKIIAERGEPTPFTFILNGIIPALDKQGVFFVDERGSKGIEEVLRGKVGVDFIYKTIADEDGEEVGLGWWFTDPNTIPYLETIPLSERVEKLVINILNDRVKVAFDEVLQEVFIKFPNSLTPNTQSIREVLEEYARASDNKWILKPRFRERLREHDKIVKNLADLGIKLGFDVHADLDGYRKDSLPFGVTSQDRVKEIDVIWFIKKEPVATFEVENTTGITEAIVRNGNIVKMDFLRVLVIPEERNRFLKRKIREPILNEQIKKYSWSMLSYGDLGEFLTNKKTKKTFENLQLKMIDLTDIKVDTQAPLQNFLKT